MGTLKSIPISVTISATTEIWRSIKTGGDGSTVVSKEGNTERGSTVVEGTSANACSKMGHSGDFWESDGVVSRGTGSSPSENNMDRAMGSMESWSKQPWVWDADLSLQRYDTQRVLGRILFKKDQHTESQLRRTNSSRGFVFCKQGREQQVSGLRYKSTWMGKMERETGGPV
ncbi:hypothetical protein AMTR_s00037p00224330 [Amborella trichopoda]|uniref:Uncharacterized protein n=1 Tax=Amborella trichopoda TaxID=13333 RepID=U5D7L9_AMBTC|nr:hypothetical protein AMTR_s00037p00224330 [Amborella trichopoda]